MNLHSRCVLFFGPLGLYLLLICSLPRVSQGFSFSPILSYVFRLLSMFSLYFFISCLSQNDENGFLYRKFDLGLLKIQNRQNSAKTCITSIATLSYWPTTILGWRYGASFLPAIFSFHQFSSKSPSFHLNLHFSSVYLQNIKISKKIC